MGFQLFRQPHVRIARINQLGGVYDTIHLTRVDLDWKDIQNNPARFFTAPNYAYKFTNTSTELHVPASLFLTLLRWSRLSRNTRYCRYWPTIFNVSDIDDTGLNHAGLDFHSVIISNRICFRSVDLMLLRSILALTARLHPWLFLNFIIALTG